MWPTVAPAVLNGGAVFGSRGVVGKKHVWADQRGYDQRVTRPDTHETPKIGEERCINGSGTWLSSRAWVIRYLRQAGEIFLMDCGAVLATFDLQMRKGAPPDGPGARVEQVGDVVRQVGPEHGWSGIIWSRLDRGSADAAITTQVRYFTSIEREFEWKLYAHDRPGDLPERLRAAGFVPEPSETLMVAKVSDVPIGVEPPEGVQLRPVTDPAGIEMVEDVHRQVFGTGLAIGRWLTAQLAAAPDAVVAVVAMAGDIPVSAARMELSPGAQFAGLWGGGTVPAWRGRGIYRSLVAFRARIAAELGYDYLYVDASDQSRPILQRLGFAALTTTTPYLYRPGARAIR